MQYIDRHDLAAMGRVWHLECRARARMGDREGILRSLRQVAAVGKANNGSWMERYHSEKTGNLGQYHFQHYCEYPANFIRSAGSPNRRVNIRNIHGTYRYNVVSFSDYGLHPGEPSLFEA